VAAGEGALQTCKQRFVLNDVEIFNQRAIGFDRFGPNSGSALDEGLPL
jgi:hypothetical protein